MRSGPAQTLVVRRYGQRDYVPTWEAMQTFTAERDADTCDELWLLEHPPVFTLGRNADAGHILDAGDIPVVHVDRGGQVTYHGPGQVVVYALIDLARRRLGIRNLVEGLEQAVINTLAQHRIAARPRRDAPGVYVDNAKVASLGLRVRRGRSYHGLSVNVAMDLEPFSRINPCGYTGLEVTQLRDLGLRLAADTVAGAIADELAAILGYNVLSKPDPGRASDTTDWPPIQAPAGNPPARR